VRRAALLGLVLAALLGPSAAAQERIAYPPFDNSAFPYDGPVPPDGRPFLDVTDGGRRGHTSPRGGIYWQERTYSDRRVLLAVPRAFDPSQPATIVVFFHGNNAVLERDVVRRQGVVRQLVQSRLNAVLVAPQMAVDALDSSAGRFWQPGHFARFLDEAAVRLGGMTGSAPAVFARAPVIVVAYSGGYLPAAYSLTVGGAEGRIRGLVLLDALYGETARFADWIGRRGAAFVVSAYSASTRAENVALQQTLRERGVAATNGLPPHVGPGAAIFVDAGAVVHNDFVTRAWTADPLRVVLSRLREIAR
jgi:hypothetical protein